jgi:hypothetical protein
MDGALALPLARRMEAQKLLDDEIAGRGGAAPGLRLIDMLGIRFVSLDTPVSTPGLRQFWHEPDMAWIMENTAALPRFQVYDRRVTVDSSEAALAVIRGLRDRALVVEDPLHLLPPGAAAIATADPGSVPATFAVLAASDTAYSLDVSAERPCWLFLADANYPGWTATIDDRPTPVVTAQVLGKAVQVPAGRHQVRIEFHSRSFGWGASISAFTLMFLAACLIGRKRTLAAVPQPAAMG